LNTEFLSDEIPKVVMGIVKAVIAHLYIAWIHPFGDGNGRTSRLMEFVILLQAGVPAPVAHLLSNHYNQTRAEYYRQLSLASQSGDALGFLNYAVDGFVDGLKEQIEKIKKYQRDITWQKFVYDAFKKEKLSSADKRRRDLVIELSSLDKPIAFSDVKLATPRIASAFAKVSQATLLRDLRVLADKELILISRGNVFVNKRLITAFLPSRAD
jgi:Fic family protein